MKHYILMADIIGSSAKDQKKLMQDFKLLAQDVNENFKQSIISPLTITLGDEFQCILNDLQTAIIIIISIEEYIIAKQLKFNLRYVLNYGLIETPINSIIAYEMLGKGLTDARSILENSKGENNRFFITIDNKLQNQLLTNTFVLLENIIENWNVEKDFEILSNFITYQDYKIVAKNIGKTRSQVWKREKSLNIKGYNAAKNILELIPQI